MPILSTERATTEIVVMLCNFGTDKEEGRGQKAAALTDDR